VNDGGSGARALLETLVNCGVDVCFGNPGTTELPLIAALDTVPAIRAVPCPFEGVATGAADGYGRIRGAPAATLLHLGPGVANGLANLHNARRAATPIVTVVGDHARDHRHWDAPLTSDIVGLARPVSAWIAESTSASTVAADTARAVQAARAAPGAVATLIVPADVAWSGGARAAPPLADILPAPVAADTVLRVARRLGSGRKAALLLRGEALQEAGLEAAGRIRAATGARLFCDTFAPRAELGAGRVPIERVPYFAEHIVSFLRGLDEIILVGARAPVSFFAYPGRASWCVPAGCAISHLAEAHEDGAGALRDLADALGARAVVAARQTLQLPDLPAGALNAMKVGEVVAHLTPDHAIYAEEATSAGLPLLVNLARARPHTHLPVAGGSLGQGLPLAVGAAIAAPARRVVCASGDGAAAYTMQALWTMARENLDVTTIIYANRAYAVLQSELRRVGVGAVGPRAASLLDLTDPALDWVQIATGLGVEASSVATAEEFAAHYASAMAHSGPRLIEVII
jgi:acetolactate synthase I/II/III large subunit